jgi:hypothetical protein
MPSINQQLQEREPMKVTLILVKTTYARRSDCLAGKPAAHPLPHPSQRTTPSATLHHSDPPVTPPSRPLSCNKHFEFRACASFQDLDVVYAA